MASAAVDTFKYTNSLPFRKRLPLRYCIHYSSGTLFILQDINMDFRNRGHDDSIRLAGDVDCLPLDENTSRRLQCNDPTLLVCESMPPTGSKEQVLQLETACF